MKRQKSATFAHKKLNKNTLMIKFCKVKGYCHYTDKYREAAHGTCNLKNRIPK